MYNNYNDNNNNSPFVERPNGSGIRLQESNINRLAFSANILGIVAIISTLTMSIYPAIMLGSTAIVMAFLSRGEGDKMEPMAAKAARKGTIAIILNIALIALVFWLIMTDNIYRDALNQALYDRYGMGLDEMIRSVLDSERGMAPLPGIY